MIQGISYANWSTILSTKHLPQEFKSAYAIERGVECKGEVLFPFPRF